MKRYATLIILAAGVVFAFNTFNKKETIDSLTTETPVAPPPQMTIPYLRSRTYASHLGEQAKYQSKTSYDSYTTSYDSDGLKINALLTVPNGEKPEGGWPAIVFVHGYIAPTIYQTTEKYVDYVDYLAKNGFVVLKIDLRGHGESEGIPSGAYYSSDYVVDTLNARAALQSAEFVNPERVGLWGHSMAGNITFRAFVAAQNIPALVIWAGAGYSYEDLRKYGLNDNSYRPPASNSPSRAQRESLREKYGDYSPESEFWRQVVPTNYLDGVKGVLQLHHAANDAVVNIGYSRDLMSILDKTDIPHELWEYPSGGHNIASPSFGLAMRRTVEFYKKNL